MTSLVGEFVHFASGLGAQSSQRVSDNNREYMLLINHTASPYLELIIWKDPQGPVR